MYRGKRLIDVLLVTATAPVWVPLLTVTAAAVRVVLGRPVFFRQERVGMLARPFTLMKFRTMREAFGSDGRPLPDTARMTRFGSFLRSTSLDELPELINVLRGQMSLVGPRPLLPEYLPRYSLEHQRRHDVRPGLTGLAQVSGRNALTWRERLDLDVAYVRAPSLRGDITLLLRTIAAVTSRRGVSQAGSATMTPFTGYED